MSVDQTIHDWRRKIDALDEQLVRLLNERSRCVVQIGKLKRAAHLPLYQPEREREILARVSSENPGPLSDTAIRRLFERILDEARAVERGAMEPEEDAPAEGRK